MHAVLITFIKCYFSMTVFNFYASENHSWWKVPNPVMTNYKNNKNKASINQQPGVILRNGLQLRSDEYKDHEDMCWIIFSPKYTGLSTESAREKCLKKF